MIEESNPFSSKQQHSHNPQIAVGRDQAPSRPPGLIATILLALGIPALILVVSAKLNWPYVSLLFTTSSGLLQTLLICGLLFIILVLLVSGSLGIHRLSSQRPTWKKALVPAQIFFSVVSLMILTILTVVLVFFGPYLSTVFGKAGIRFCLLGC